MSKTIDERVVSLQFDNKNFEKNAKDTMSTLDKLKEKLNFKNASKGLEEVNDAAKNVNMSGLENNVGKVGLKFNWLHSVAHSALDRITNKVMDTGERLIKSLTIDPVKTGLKEYETQLNSVQTILANTESKGSTLKDVNNALDELNRYADMTIYNFTEMTRNIGTFTAAGVDLNTSVNSIKGIANLAAVSGSTSQQASTAMYQLSQALASGTVKLMDWNSVVNAGMGGEVFQNALKETARVHGVAIDDIIKSQGSFRESLSEGWLTSEILTETLDKFTMATDGVSKAEIEANRVKLRNIGYTEKQIDEIFKLGNSATNAATKVKTASQMIDVMKESAQSGWAQSWEIIIGDFEEAKELWTMASDAFTKVIGDSAEKRNKLLKDVLSSGWDKWMEKGIMDEEGYEFHLKELIKQDKKIANSLTNAGLGGSFEELIESNGGSLVKALRQGFEKGAIPADVLSESLSRLTDAYSRYTDEELKAAGYTREQYNNMVDLNDQFQNGKISAEDFAKAITKLSGRELIFDKDLGILPNIFKSIYEAIKPIGNAWEAIFPSDGKADKIYNILAKIQEKVLGFKEAVTRNSDKIFRTFRGLFSIVGMVWYVFKSLFNMLKRVKSAFQIVNINVLDVTAGMGDFLYSLYKALTGSEKFTSTLNRVGDALVSVGKGIKNFFTIAKSKIDTSGFDGFLDVLKKIWNFIKNLFSTILTVIKNIAGSIADTIDGSGITSIFDILNAGLLIALIVKIKNLFSGLDNILDGFRDIMDGVSDTLNAFQKRIKAEALKAIGIAIALLAGSILVLSLINKDKLEVALAAITMLFIELTVLMKIVGKSQYALKGGGSMIAMGATLLLMAMALKKLAGIGWDKIIPAMGAMGLALLSFVAVLGITSKMNTGSIHAFKMIAIITALSMAMIPLSLSMKIIAKMDWDSVLKGLAMVGAVVVALVTVMGLMKLLSGSSKGIKIKDAFNPVLNIADGLGQALKEVLSIWAQGAAIAMLAFALLEIAGAIALLAMIPWEKMKYGLLGMSIAFIILMSAVRIMNKIDAKNSIKNAFALLLLIAPLTTIALLLVILTRFHWEELMMGLIVMGVALDTLVVSLKRIGKTNPEKIGAKVFALMALLAPMIGMTLLLEILGNTKWDKISKGLLAMNIMLSILSTTLKRLSKINSGTLVKNVTGVSKGGMFSFLGTKSDLIQKASALLILTAAMTTMSICLAILGNLKWSTIIKGLTAMAGVLLVLGVTSKFLSTIGTGFMTFSMGALSMGLACLTAAAGVYLLAKGLNIIIKSLGSSINTLCAVIIESGPLIAQAITVIVVSLLDSLVDITSELVSKMMQILVNSIRSSAEYIPEMADAFMDLLVGVADVLVEYIPEIVQIFGKVLSKLFGAIFDELSNVDSGVFVKILLGITAMVLIMKQLAKLKKDAINAAIGAVGLVAVFSILIGLFGLIAQNVSSGFIEGAVKVIKEIGAPDVVLSLGLLGLLMSAIMGIAKKFKLTDSGSFKIIFKMTANLVIFISALILLYSVIGLFATIDGFTSNIERAVEVIKIIGAPHVVGCLTLLSALMIAINAASQYLLLSYNLNDMLKVAKNLVIFIAALVLLFSAIGLFTTIDGFTRNIEGAAKVIKILGMTVPSLTLLAALMIAIGYVTEKFKVNIKPKNILLVAGALALFIGALAILFGVLGLLANIKGVMDTVKQGANLIGIISTALTVSLGLLMGLVIVISKIPINGSGLGNIAKNAAGLAIIIGVLSLLALAIGGLAMIPGVNTALTQGIGILKQICDPNVILALGMLTILSVALAAFSLVGINAMLGGAMLAGVVLELAIILYALGAIAAIPDVENTIKTGLDVIKLLGAPDTIIAFGLITLFIAAVGLMAPLIGAAVLAMTGLISVIAVITTAMIALGAIYKIPGVLEMIADGGKMLAAIGIAIGSFLGGILGGIVNGVVMGATENLPELAKRFSGFMVNLMPFLLIAKTIPDGISETVGELAEALLYLTGANLLSQITEWLFGEQDLSYFGTTLSAFGKGVKAFNDEVVDIKVSTIVKGAEAGKILAEMAKEMPRQDGLWQKIIGKKDIGSFGSTLQTFGEGVKLFGIEVSEINPDTIKAGAEAGTILAKMAKELPREDGLWQKLWGGRDIEGFGSNMENFGHGIGQFGKNISVVDADKIKAGAEASVYLVKKVQELPSDKTTGLLSLDTTLLRNKLNGLHVAIAEFVTNMSGVSSTNIESIKTKMNTLTTTIQSLTKNGVQAMTSTFKNSTSDVAGAVSTTIQAAIDKIKSYGLNMVTAGKELIASFINGIKMNKQVVTNTVTELVKETSMKINNTTNYDLFYDAGAYLIEGLANGITDSSYLSEQAASAAAKAAKTAIDNALGIESPSTELYESGEYTIEGYTNALDDGQSDIAKAGKSLGNRVLAAVNNCILKIQHMLDEGIEINPVIRPTLDLSSVEAGMGSLNGMFGNSTFMARVQSTSAQMNKNQNGGNDDIVDAIEKVGNKLDTVQGDKISVGNLNINTTDDEDIANAIEVIIRKVILERRR